MILAGDEFGRTQHGNNNVLSGQQNFLDKLNFDSKSHNLLQFTRFLKFFHSHPILQRRRFFNGRNTRTPGIKDLTWFHPDGKEMTEGDWNNPQIRYLPCLAGDAIEEVDEHGEQIIDDTLLILLNGHFEPVTFICRSASKMRNGNLYSVQSTRSRIYFRFYMMVIILRNGKSRSLSLLRLPISSVSGPEKSINIMENALRILRRQNVRYRLKADGIK